ncbi:hypothetical protein WMY93_006977 [Mugilogobius chulae]|uniref:GTP-binding protein 1 n=1 Tax=Mugilogobius chulae TaxID=88201 RepID=A0AAW0PNX2_9GOBI
MSSLKASEPGAVDTADTVVPASMFAPDRAEDGAESEEERSEGGDEPNGHSAEVLDLTNKFLLVSPNAKQYDALLRHLRDRIDEGSGETIYVIGMGSDGGDYGLNEADMEASVATVHSLCEQIEADLVLLRERPESGGQVRDYLIRRRVGEQDFLEVRVAVVGNVDAGKSTLLGVLTHGELDNGRGFARQKLFRHKHEMESGRTSSVGNDILGFDQEGQVRERERYKVSPQLLNAASYAIFKNTFMNESLFCLFVQIKRSAIRKGMVMVSPKLQPQATWEFEAEIIVLHHPTTISPRYQAMVHCGSIRQTATILSMNKDCLRTGDKAAVHFRFIKTPEYLHPEQKLVFREGRTKAVGTITKLLQSVSTAAAKAQQSKTQSYRKRDGTANEEAPSAARPGSPTSSQLQLKSGGAGRRRGGNRHRSKALNVPPMPAPLPTGAGTA